MDIKREVRDCVAFTLILLGLIYVSCLVVYLTN